MGPHGLNEDGCELKRIHCSELSLPTRAKETRQVEFEEGLAVARFRYTSVEDLQNAVVELCSVCRLAAETGRRPRGLYLTYSFTSKPL